MDIYFAKINNSNNEILGKFHHKFSRVFLKYLLKNVYKIDLPILEDGKKPYIESDLKFSISHSQNLLAIAFDKNEIGIDVGSTDSANVIPNCKDVVDCSSTANTLTQCSD